jgi:hypothetical protein
MASTSFGQDTFCLTDVGLTDVQVTDPRIIIGQRIGRILQMPLGALANIGDDPGVGFDVKQLLNAKLTPTFLSQSQSKIEAQCSRDAEVQSATATITRGAGGTIVITIQLMSAVGPFQLVLNVSQLTVDLLFNF